MGVQTVSERLLAELGREGSASVYERAVANIRAAGFQSFNIDLMFGFLYQTDADFRNTLRYAAGLNPEHITLYRNRYKGTKLEHEAGGVSIYKAVYQYRLAYDLLTECGYRANIGKNTFSRVPGDYGTSDYLTKRVIEGMPYVGMGLGAQSFGMDYLAYNLGAAEKRMERYRKAITEGRFPIQDIYRLPKEESIAKMVSVAFYFAFVDLAAFRARFGLDFCEYFRDEVAFVLENKLMELHDGRLWLTPRGADHINGVIPLFYSQRSKEELKTAFAAKSLGEENDEQLFLGAYNIDSYFRPSVAVDMAIFGRRAGKIRDLLLIRRGEHPYMNHWALAGGFLKSDETLEQATARELREETGVTAETLIPVGNYSAVARDPRGRVISCAYTAAVDEERCTVLSGDDALDAQWFALDVQQSGDVYTLTLTSGGTVLTAALRKTAQGFAITANSGLAFDHAEIILDAYLKIQ
jgi:oxygen-independent coproporphyrinogen-3 oxidase